MERLSFLLLTGFDNLIYQLALLVAVLYYFYMVADLID